MKAKIVFFTIAALILSSIPLAEAQPPGKVYRVGILRGGSPSYYVSQHEVVRQALRELGYIEGKNLLIEYRYAESKLERLPDLAAELVGLKVDVLVISAGPAPIRAAKEATRTMPIVLMGAVIDPVEAGFVESLRRPGGNITGMTDLESDLHPKRLELLKEAFPRISRVAIIWSLTQQKQAMKEVKATGQALGVSIQPLIVKTRIGLASLEKALSTISQESPDALLVPSIRITLRHRARVIDFAAERRLPVMYGSSRFVDAGGLMSYRAVAQIDFFRAVSKAHGYNALDRIAVRSKNK